MIIVISLGCHKTSEYFVSLQLAVLVPSKCHGLIQDSDFWAMQLFDQRVFLDHFANQDTW